ncbi:MAG: chitobiase/beta-hexosaminidase C-terminal domain-containing protein, partial [Bacteroidaceae bacterium]|nr:chitobiase/beta-hexosaminidase C-terminal domain-containing protein [Bacteroidaceae bacterium]
PEGNATASGTFDIELAAALPFEFAASYDEVENWYVMTIHSNSKFYLADNDTAAYIALDKKSIPASELDKYTWGFVGDPITGFQIVNKAAGKTKILSSSTTTTDGNTGGSTFPILTEVPVADGNNTYWIPSQGSVENGFFLAQKDYANNKMNARSGKLAYWNTGADAGSTFLVTERDMDAELPSVAFAPTGEENVASIDTITVTCANGIALSNNSELKALLNAYIWDAATGSATQISKELTAAAIDDATIILTVDSAITTEGNWYLNIPAGYFVMNVNGAAIESADLSGSYNVVDNSPLTITEMSAAGNSVINDFAIDVTMVFSHDVSEYPSGRAYILDADNDTISEVAISAQDADGNWFPEYNKLRIYSKEEIEKSGVYTLVLPEGYITRTSDGAGLAATTLTYTLSIPVTISAPILDNEGGVYTDEFLRVAFSVNTTGVSYPSVKYYYTTDGTTPTKESDYSGAAMLYEGCTLKVMAVMKVDTVEYVSEVTTAEYIFSEMKPFKVATSNAELADGKIFISANDSLVAKSLPADYNYGYLYTATKAAANGYIENAVYYGFTLTAVDTCYTIQDQYGRYLYQTGNYNSFNVSDTLPESGALWTISIAENGEAAITNVAVNKYIQYSTQYESFGSYASAQNNAVMPKIYVPCEYPTLSYYPCEYPQVESLTTITFTCESGIALNEEFSAILTDYMNEYELVANVIDDNTIELTVSEELSAGAWNMVVPAGMFILDPNGMALANSEVYDSYTIIDNTPLAIDECTPAEGDVTSLKYVIVAFNKDINPYGDAILKDAEGETVATASYGFVNPETNEELPWNYVVYTLPEEITEAGTYTLVIPEGTIYCNNEFAPEFTIAFTITGATGIEGVGAENGEQEIYDITGRKVKSITAPGIYIVNGKKVVIK